MTMGQKIHNRRIELNLSVDDVANKLGKNRATVYRYESGDIGDMPTSVLAALAKILKTTPADLMVLDDDESEKGNDHIFDFSNISPIERKKYPLLGKIACGVPSYAAEDRESYVASGTALKADFCLTAHGDSMINARICDGDIVFIRRQDMVENGEIAAVEIGDEATLKRVYYYRDANLLILRAENPAYEDLTYQGQELEQVHILGMAVAFQSNVK